MSDHTNGHSADCIVVGAGLAGLACARTLVRAGRRVIVLDAADRVGGRVATDTVDGFRLDRGFQVYNDAYPEGRRQLDLSALRLGRFETGALVALAGRLRRVADPWRRPLAAVGAVLDGTIGIGDGLRTARLRSDVLRALAGGRLDPDTSGDGQDRSTREELLARGFSSGFVRRFFVPFFGGVFLERELDTSADVFRFDFAMFARGSACLPHGGMEAIPRQLAAALPDDAVRLRARVERVEPGRAVLVGGETLSAAAVIVATEGTAAARLLPAEHRGELAARRWKGTRLIAFAADRSPLPSPTLVVNADGGPIDNLTVPSDVVSGYAPPGRALICVSVRPDAPTDDDALADAVRRQAAGWFGDAASIWRRLAVVRVDHALPDESPASRRLRAPGGRLATGLFLCGDHCASASINGALASGRRCAEAVLATA